MMRCAYHACVDGKPAGVLKLFAGLRKEIGVGGITKLNVNPELVTGLVVRADRHVLDVLGIHPVNVDIDFEDTCVSRRLLL